MKLSKPDFARWNFHRRCIERYDQPFHLGNVALGFYFIHQCLLHAVPIWNLCLVIACFLTGTFAPLILHTVHGEDRYVLIRGTVVLSERLLWSGVSALCHAMMGLDSRGLLYLTSFVHRVPLDQHVLVQSAYSLFQLGYPRESMSRILVENLFLFMILCIPWDFQGFENYSSSELEKQTFNRRYAYTEEHQVPSLEMAFLCYHVK